MKSVDDYIRAFPGETQLRLNKVRALIKKIVPDATEVIRYGIPTFRYHGNLVHYAGYKHHIGFYPGASGIKAFAKELKGYKHAKGSVQFPLNQPLPSDLIRKIVEFRLEETLAKTKSGK